MQRINEDIKTGNFKQIYLLYGEERYLKNQYTTRLRKALCQDGDEMNTHFYQGKDFSLGQVIDLAETLPFLAERRVMFFKDTGLFKAGGEKLAEYLANPNDTTFFVFTESEVDKRSKLYKAVQSKGYVAEFTVQDENTLKRWIAGILGKEGKKISENTAQLLLSKTGTDMENIQMELEKLITYTMGKDVVTAEDIEEICTTRTENKIFDMVRAVTEKNQRKALDLYNDLLTLREPPMRILFLLSKQFRQMCLAKKMSVEGASQNEIATRLGVPSFAVRNLLACARAYKIEELEKAEEDFIDAEEAVKARMEAGEKNEMGEDLRLPTCTRLLMGIPFWALAIWVSYLIIATPMHRHKVAARKIQTEVAVDAELEPSATGKDDDAS